MAREPPEMAVLVHKSGPQHGYPKRRTGGGVSRGKFDPKIPDRPNLSSWKGV